MSTRQEPEYPFVFYSIFRLLLFYAGFYFLYLFIDTCEKSDALNSSLGGAEGGSSAVLLVYAVIWTVVWYMFMMIILGNREKKATSQEIKLNRFVMLFPVCSIFLTALIYIMQTIGINQ